MTSIDLNNPEVAKAIIAAIDTRIELKLPEIIKNVLTNWVKGTVATSGSGLTISCYINNSTTAVDVNNPRRFSLVAGNLVAIRYPNNRNDRDKFIDYIL